MTYLIVIAVTAVVITLFCIVMLWREEKDKQYRRENNLPARKYHSVSDYDVHQVFTVSFGKDRRK